MRLEDVQEVLSDLADSFELVARLTLKNNGNSAEDCQLIGIVEALSNLQARVNGISESDLRYPALSAIPANHPDRNYPAENIIMSSVSLDNALSDLQRNAGSAAEAFGLPNTGSRTLFALIDAICTCDAGASFDGEEFNCLLAEIQNVIGQTDGMGAGMFFDDALCVKWTTSNKAARASIMGEYIAFEIKHQSE